MTSYKIFGPIKALKELGATLEYIVAPRIKQYGLEGAGLFVMKAEPEKIGISQCSPLDYRVDLGFVAFQIWIEPCEFVEPLTDDVRQGTEEEQGTEP